MNRAEFMELANRIACYSEEDWWEGRVPEDTPDLPALTEALIESSGEAFGHPAFEKYWPDAMHRWASEGKLLRVQMFAAFLTERASDRHTLAELERWASGDYLDLLNSRSCPWPGPVTAYLYPLNLKLLLWALQERENQEMQRRATVNARVFASTGKKLW